MIERKLCALCGEYEEDCLCGDAQARLAKWESFPQRFVCIECGWVKTDQDGCCVTCGRECALVAVLYAPAALDVSSPRTSAEAQAPALPK